MHEQDKLRIIKSDKYLDWIVDFTNKTPEKCWDDESANFYRAYLTQYDMNNVALFNIFVKYVLELATKQYVVSLPHHKLSDFRYNIKLRGNFYEVSLVSHSCINTIKQIREPEGKPIFIDEPIDPKELKDREFIQYILVNKDLQVPSSVLAVHIAHACTICTMEEKEKPAFNMWFNGKQKIVILDASKEQMEQLEPVSYGIRDTGHNDIPKNSLIAISLGIIPKKKALILTEGCTLHKD